MIIFLLLFLPFLFFLGVLLSSHVLTWLLFTRGWHIRGYEPLWGYEVLIFIRRLFNFLFGFQEAQSLFFGPLSLVDLVDHWNLAGFPSSLGPWHEPIMGSLARTHASVRVALRTYVFSGPRFTSGLGGVLNGPL